MHGNEPGDREACLIMARQLAFSNDARTIDLLSHTTVLIVPTINGDGRATNTRGNATGQDLNRDYSLIRQPETPRSSGCCATTARSPATTATSTATPTPVTCRCCRRGTRTWPGHLRRVPGHDRGPHVHQGAQDGWWACPYGCEGGSTVGQSEETILRNTLGLKNVVNSLLELRSSGGPTRPDEGNTANNRRRKTYSALWTFHQFLDYHRANRRDPPPAPRHRVPGRQQRPHRLPRFPHRSRRTLPRTRARARRG